MIWPTRAARFVAALCLGGASLLGLGLVLSRGEGQDPGAGVVASAGPARALAGMLDLNTASRAELEMLPGVGPALAGRIIAERDEVGAFASVEDLERVKGIGPRTLERLRGLVRVSGPLPRAGDGPSVR